MKKLYELPENQNVKLYFEDTIVIFGHLDGLYSYCWLEEDKTKLVHINSCANFEEYKDGYKYIDKIEVE